MGSGYSKMKKQAKLMEQQLETLRVEMENKIFMGSAGNHRVSVAMDGNKELKKITIDKECVDKNDVEGLQDLILAACQEAYQKVAQESPQKGFSLPF